MWSTFATPVTDLTLRYWLAIPSSFAVLLSHQQSGQYMSERPSWINLTIVCYCNGWSIVLGYWFFLLQLLLDFLQCILTRISPVSFEIALIWKATKPNIYEMILQVTRHKLAASRTALQAPKTSVSYFPPIPGLWLARTFCDLGCWICHSCSVDLCCTRPSTTEIGRMQQQNFSVSGPIGKTIAS